MNIIFKPFCNSWVAVNPNPIGVIEFIGGALYGSLPNICYAHFLHTLFEAGYTIIALPFKFGFNHESIAKTLLLERNEVLAELNYPQNIPHFWVGHSLGCKYVILLEAYGAIMNQPSLLIAPDISDTKDAVPFPGLANFLDKINWGANPTRKETQALVQKSNLFNLTALISFEKDVIAGTKNSPIDKSDVAWFIHELQDRKDGHFLAQEIPGRHSEVVGIKVGNLLLYLDLKSGIFGKIKTRKLEPLALEVLNKLRQHMLELAVDGTEVNSTEFMYRVPAEAVNDI